MKKITLLGALLLAACSGSGNGQSGPATADGVELLAGFTPDPAPANGFRVVLPIVHDIKPGDSLEYCSWTNMILDHDIDIKATKGNQTATGHHAIVFYTTKMVQPGTQRICTDDDMANFRFVSGAGGEGVNAVALLPGDLVSHVPKGAQLAVNHHYLNAGDKVMDAQTEVTVRYNDPGAPAVHSSAVAWMDTSLDIPPGAYGLDINCTMNDDVQFWMLLPHMHQWGQHITVDHTVAGQAAKRLFDVAWDPDYAFHPPTITNDPNTPYVMNKGDSFKVHCDWNNTTGMNLSFGLEMCIAFGMTIDTQMIGNVGCDKGSWGPF